MSTEPVTKEVLAIELKDLRSFIVEREIVALRWVICIQTAYFFGTLGAVWFMLSHYKP
jgi:hypothetical protein